jgi:hypothetical protein
LACECWLRLPKVMVIIYAHTCITLMPTATRIVAVQGRVELRVLRSTLLTFTAPTTPCTA